MREQFQCIRLVVLGGIRKVRYTAIIVLGMVLVCIIQLSKPVGLSNTTAEVMSLEEEPETDWDECKFHIDSLKSWREEQLCKNRLSINSRPDTCDDCFDPTVLLTINAPTVCDEGINQGIIDVLFIISSLHEHFRLRTRIRNNWGAVTANNTANFRLVFLLGTSPNADVMRQVRQEASLFGDLLVGQFNDHYYNLTFKTMMGVNWAVKYCSHARFFTKMDDDVWVNINALMEKLQENRLYLQEAIGGMCFVKALVKRNKTSKWYVPKAYYASSFYPQYCYGFAYVGGMAVLEQVSAISRHVPFFFVDDVYVGMCLEQVGFGVIKFPGFKDLGETCKDRDIDDIAVHGALHWQVVPYCGQNPPPTSIPSYFDASDIQPFYKFKRSKRYKPFSEHKSRPREYKFRSHNQSKLSQSKPFVLSDTVDSKPFSQSKPFSSSKPTSQSKSSSQSKPSSLSTPSSSSKPSFQSKPSSQSKLSPHFKFSEESKSSSQAKSDPSVDSPSSSRSTPLYKSSPSLSDPGKNPEVHSEYTSSPEATPLPASNLLSQLKPSFLFDSNEFIPFYKSHSTIKSRVSNAYIFSVYFVITIFIFIAVVAFLGLLSPRIFVYYLKKLWLFITKHFIG